MLESLELERSSELQILNFIEYFGLLLHSVFDPQIKLDCKESLIGKIYVFLLDSAHCLRILRQEVLSVTKKTSMLDILLMSWIKMHQVEVAFVCCPLETARFTSVATTSSKLMTSAVCWVGWQTSMPMMPGQKISKQLAAFFSQSRPALMFIWFLLHAASNLLASQLDLGFAWFSEWVGSFEKISCRGQGAVRPGGERAEPHGWAFAAACSEGDPGRLQEGLLIKVD